MHTYTLYEQFLKMNVSLGFRFRFIFVRLFRFS